MKLDNQVLIIFGLVLLFMVLFSDGIITMIILSPYLPFNILGFIYPDGKDSSDYDGGALLNCMRGGVCPSGVTYQELDEDGDGFTNSYDDCPHIYSEVNNGCPIPLSNPTGAFVDEIEENVVWADEDGDGIRNSLDECIYEPETINGFLDSDGCPETTSNNKVVTELPEVDVIDVMINPPDIVPTLIAESNSPITVQEVNLNESVDYAILIYVIILFVIITIFIMFLKKGKLL